MKRFFNFLILLFTADWALYRKVLLLTKKSFFSDEFQKSQCVSVDQVWSILPALELLPIDLSLTWNSEQLQLRTMKSYIAIIKPLKISGESHMYKIFLKPYILVLGSGVHTLLPWTDHKIFLSNSPYSIPQYYSFNKKLLIDSNQVCLSHFQNAILTW